MRIQFIQSYLSRLTAQSGLSLSWNSSDGMEGRKEGTESDCESRSDEVTIFEFFHKICEFSHQLLDE
jgi:hypothetical protein